MFDFTITLGNALTIVTMGVTGLGFVWTMKAEIKVLVQRLDNVEGAMAKITDALIQLARQEVRLDAHADRISRLEGQERQT
jgi:hypothetical protein